MENIISNKKAKIYLAIAIILWGMSIVVDKYALNVMSIGIYAGIKYTIAALVFFAIHPPNLRRFFNTHTRGLSIRVLIYSIKLSLFFAGVSMLSGFNIVIVLALSPIMIFISSILIVHEKFRPRILSGLIVAILGVSLMIFTTQNGGDSTNILLGNLLLFGALLADVAGILYSKKLFSEHVRPDMIVRVLLAWAAMFFLTIGLLSSGVEEIIRLTLNDWMILFLSGVVFTMLPNALYYHAFKRVKVEELSTFVYLDPLAGAVGAMVILGEVPTIWVILGGALVLFGLWLSQHRAVHYKLHFHVPHHMSIREGASYLKEL